MARLDLTEEQVDRAVSLIGSSLIVMERSGDWPEKKKDKELLKRLVILQGILRRGERKNG